PPDVGRIGGDAGIADAAVEAALPGAAAGPDGPPDAGQVWADAKIAVAKAVDVPRPGAAARPHASPNAGRVVGLKIASAELTPGEWRGGDTQGAGHQSRCQEALHTTLLFLEKTGGWQDYPMPGGQKETCAILRRRKIAHAFLHASLPKERYRSWTRSGVFGGFAGGGSVLPCCCVKSTVTFAPGRTLTVRS